MFLTDYFVHYMHSQLVLVLGKSPPSRENSHPSNSPWKTLPRKIPTLKIPPWNIPTWNIPTYFINCLSSLSISSINGRERVYMYILLPGGKTLISPERLKFFLYNFGNINKIFIFIQNIPLIIY